MIKRIALLFLAYLSISTNISAVQASHDASQMRRQEVDKLLSSGKFKHVKGKSDLPKIWWKSMELDGMSDIGGRFSAGCTGSDPHCRLMAAAVSEPYAAEVSEQGGAKYSTVFRFFKHGKDATNCVYLEYIFKKSRMAEIRKQLGEQNVD